MNDASRARGMALVSSLLILMIVTVLAMGMFRALGAQEKIAGNLREKNRALHAAITAQQYAEWWLTQGSNATATPVNCDGTTVLSANSGQGQICSNRLTSVTSPPLQVAQKDVGMTLNPGQRMKITPISGRDTYLKMPRFYIASTGASADGAGMVYQIDAVGYGATSSAVAVVESTYLVFAGVRDLGGP